MRSGENLGSGGLTFIAGMVVVDLSNFLFNLIFSRVLGPEGYGELGSFLNILLVVSVGVSALQAGFVQASARLGVDEDEYSMSAVLLRTATAGCGLGAMVAVLSIFFESFLHVNSIVLVLEAAVCIPLSLLGAALQGFFMGRMRFGIVALALVVGVGPVRLFFGFILVEAGFGPAGALGGTIAGLVVTLTLLVGALGRKGFHRKGTVLKVNLSDEIRSVVALAGVSILTGEGTILARHFLSAHNAGLYVAGATAGNIALFLPAAVTLIVFPKFVLGIGQENKARNILRWSLGFTAISGAATAAFIALAPSLISAVLFGGQYSDAIDVIRLLGFEGFLLGVSTVLVYYHLARRSRWCYTPWGAVFVAYVVILLFHNSILIVGSAMLGVATVLVVVLLTLTAHMLLKDPPVASVRAACNYLCPASQTVDLSVVVPFYNPGEVLISHMKDIVDVLTQSGISYEILAVSDGSSDGSAEALSIVGLDKVVVSELEVNMGKGEALWQGFSQSSGKYVGFIDADGDIPAKVLLWFVDVIRSDNPEILVGSKRHPRSSVDYTTLRRVYSWGFQQLSRLLFNLPVRDTQAGIKFFRRDIIAEILPHVVETRFAFDLELMVVASRFGFANIVELPVIYVKRLQSTINIRAVRGMIADALGIFYRLRVLHYYERASSAATVVSEVPDTTEIR